MPSTQENLGLISDLILLAHADEELSEPEYTFIHTLAKRMKLDALTVDKLFSEPIASKPITSELKRITHFHKLVLLMNIDNNTHPKEVVILKGFALKMGIRATVVDEILVRMGDYEDKIIPSEVMLKIFQTYYN